MYTVYQPNGREIGEYAIQACVYRQLGAPPPIVSAVCVDRRRRPDRSFIGTDQSPKQKQT